MRGQILSGVCSPGGWLLSAAEIVATYRMLMEIAEDVDGFAVQEWADEPWWHPQWLPFDSSDGGTGFIDLRDGPGRGRLGIGGHDGENDFTDGFTGLTDYLDQPVTALLTGSLVAASQALLLGDKLWWDRPGETEVNGLPLRPAPPR